MKREYRPTYYEWRQTWNTATPFFWKKCCKCGYEFRREAMMVRDIYHSCGVHEGYWSSVWRCMGCFLEVDARQDGREMTLETRME